MPQKTIELKFSQEQVDEIINRVKSEFYPEIERLRQLAATAEKWRGIASAKFGDGRTVSEIQVEAALFELEECGKLCDDMAKSYASNPIFKNWEEPVLKIGALIRARKKGNKASATKVAPVQQEPVFDQGVATRLRNVCRMVGIEENVPESDETLHGAMFAVLGQIGRALATKQERVGCLGMPVSRHVWEMADALAQQQDPLGDSFQKVLNENRDALYETTGTPIPQPDHAEALANAVSKFLDESGKGEGIFSPADMDAPIGHAYEAMYHACDAYRASKK